MFQMFLKKFFLAIKSKTVWTVVIIFLVNGLSAIRALVPVHALPVVDVVLSLAAVVFKVMPSQNYSA